MNFALSYQSLFKERVGLETPFALAAALGNSRTFAGPDIVCPQRLPLLRLPPDIDPAFAGSFLDLLDFKELFYLVHPLFLKVEVAPYVYDSVLNVLDWLLGYGPLRYFFRQFFKILLLLAVMNEIIKILSYYTFRIF
jgi:hypothetical protein